MAQATLERRVETDKRFSFSCDLHPVACDWKRDLHENEPAFRGLWLEQRLARSLLVIRMACFIPSRIEDKPALQQSEIN